MQMTKTVAQKVRNLMEKVLEEHREEFEEAGVVPKCGSGSFSEVEFSLKVIFNVVEEGGEVMTQEKEDFINFATYYGLSADNLGDEFTNDGSTFKICGLKRRAHKFPILATCVSGKKVGATFKFPADIVALRLGS